MEPNIPLLRKVVEWVEEQAQLPQSERTWDQERWVCGTRMCVAGKVVLDDGWTPLGASTVSVKKGGAVGFVSDIALDLLGLTQDQGHALFYGANRAPKIRKTAELIAGEPL